MKPLLLLPLLSLLGTCTQAQGTFIYDQQDSTSEGSPPYGSGPSIQSLIPGGGQSFTPLLQGIDFIRLTFDDGNPADTLGASIFLNLRSGSIAGPILGTTATVSMANGFSGPVNFLFPTRVPLASGTQYYFDLNLASGGPWNVEVGSFNYPGGYAYSRGVALQGSEFWFREGIIAPVPEPSAYAMLLLAGGMVVCASRARRK